MKSILLFSIFMIVGIIGYSQELRDTSTIIVEYSNNNKLNMFRVKDNPHYNSGNDFKYPSDPSNMYALAADGRTNIDNALLQSFSTKTMKVLKGKLIMLRLKVNGNGDIKSVVVCIPDTLIKKDDITKKEIFQLIKNIEKGVRFDVSEEAKAWSECSFALPHRVK